MKLYFFLGTANRIFLSKFSTSILICKNLQTYFFLSGCDKITVENICNGVVFGNSNYTTKVKKQTGRSVVDITPDCNLSWGNDSLTVYYDGAKLGGYTYTVANPVLSCPSKVEYNGQGACPKVTVKIGNNILKELLIRI